MTYFDGIMDRSLEYAQECRAQGRPIIGILCEYTPRELILAAGGVPVCLCGGSADTIGPAEEHLPANLCPLIKSTYGYHVTRGNPFLEMADLVVAETTCDGKKKMYELMAQTRPMYVLELPQKPGDSDAFAHWLAELRKLQAFLEARYKVGITPERLAQAAALMNRYRALRRRLAEFLALSAPPITGRQLLGMNSSIWCAPRDMDEYAKAIDTLAAAAPRDDLALRVRVLVTGVPMLRGAEKVIEIIENSGGLVVCMENCSGLKPVLQDVDERGPDVLSAVARKYFDLPCSVMTPNDGRVRLLRDLAAQYRADCIIDVSWQACLTYDVESRRVGLLAQELRLPYLRISTDYSPNDAARIALRVEALFETIRG
jgi:benzoyl-CoA reductase/2-hydroxyglutaryl-CoA dehydratase subunit BcrC/BadD/HgdB